jgi:hypothetical protein
MSPTTPPLRCAFVAASWSEAPLHEMEGAGKLSHASIVNTLSGDIEGEGRLEYLMQYPVGAGGDVAFIGYERVIVSIGERRGSFTLRHDGVYSASAGVHGTLSVVADSGSGAFAGIGGHGTLEAKAGEHGGQYTLTLQ